MNLPCGITKKVFWNNLLIYFQMGLDSDRVFLIPSSSRNSLHAEVAELADALGSGPSPVYPGWRFKSSLRYLSCV